MKFGAFLAALLTGIFALGGVVYIFRYSDYATDESPAPKPTLTLFDAPEIAPEGPYPAAETESTVHDFGVAEIGSKGEHTFVVRNTGEAPLELVANQGDSTCQCTVGTLGEAVVQPGESTEVTLSWEIKSRGDYFEHSANIRTNDPERTILKFFVRGHIGKTIVVKPRFGWTVGWVTDEQPAQVVGLVYSEVLDEFLIKEIQTNSDYVTADFRKLDATELAQINRSNFPAVNFDDPSQTTGSNADDGDTDPQTDEQQSSTAEDSADGKQPHAKSGYAIQVTVSPDIPVGRFATEMAITLDTLTRGEQTISAAVSANRTSPIQILAFGDTKWNSDMMHLSLGRFSASEGSAATLSIFVKEFEGELELVELETDPEFIEVTLEKDEDFQGSTQRYLLKVAAPPGSPPVERIVDVGMVRIKTNHPKADSIEFSLVLYSS